MVDAVNVVREAAHPLTGAATDYDPLMETVGDAATLVRFRSAVLPEMVDGVVFE